MKVHDLFVALSQCNRGATVSIKDGKLYVGGKVLKVKGSKPDVEDEPEETKPVADEKPEGDEEKGGDEE